MSSKIRMDDSVHLCYVGNGANYHVARWLPALARAGLKVTLLTFDVPDSPLEGVTCIGLRRPMGPKARYIDYTVGARRLRQRLYDLDCDVLMGSYATHYGWLAARTGFAPFIMQTWTGDLTIYPFARYKRLVFHPVVTYGFHRADLITTDGRALYEKGVALFPEFAEKLVPTRWGIIQEPTDVLSQRSKTTFGLSVGIDNLERYTVVTSPRGLQGWYQPDLAIRSLLSALEQESTLFALVLTLNHERKAAVQDLLNELARHPRARVLDRFLSPDEMKQVWLATDVVVSVPHADGVSESVLESTYFGGLPVLSDIPSNRSLVDDGLWARIVDHSVSTAMDAVLDVARMSATDAAEIRQRNHDWIVANATIEATASELAHHVRQLAGRHQNR